MVQPPPVSPPPPLPDAASLPATPARAAGRTTYRHGDLHRALLDAAMDLARQGGPDAVVLREATRRADVAPNAAYRHFASRQDLLDAVRRAALAAMSAAIQQELAQQPPGDQRPQDGPADRARAYLRAVGLGYLRYALAEPGLFRTAFSPGFGRRTAEPPQSPAEAAGARDPLQHLCAALDGMVAAGALPPERRPGAEFLAWSAVHGMALLVLDGPLAGRDDAQIQPLARRLVAMVERGL